MTRAWWLGALISVCGVTASCGDDAVDEHVGAGAGGSGASGGGASGAGATAGDGAAPIGGSLGDRSRDPVVLRGLDLEPLLGKLPNEIVAFAWDGAWKQIPVQVDERHPVQPSMHYKDAGCCHQPTEIEARYQATTSAYADPLTYSGADVDPTFDVDDELVFMARDAGSAAPDAELPAGVDASSPGLRIRLQDPLAPGEQAFVHLFVRADAALDPAAGADYVSYQVSFGDGSSMLDYKLAYDRKGLKAGAKIQSCIDGGELWPRPNPENSVVSTATYRTAFSERWIQDQLEPVETGIDLIDLHLSRPRITACGRSNASFSGAHGGFIAQIDGPVRAIRSVFGANSGPHTERTHLFYDGRYDVLTTLRVHTLPGGMDLMDYAPEAGTLHYFNDNNPDGEGLSIDGQGGDAFVSGPITWEVVTGDAGSLVMTHLLASSFLGEVTLSSYFQDQSNAACQCLGDAHARGASGPYLGNSLGDNGEYLPDTYQDSPDHLTSFRTLEVHPPNLSAEQRQAIVKRAQTPLAVEVQSLAGTSSAPRSSAKCGDQVCDTSEASGWCGDCPWATCGNRVCEPYELWPAARCDADCGGQVGDSCGDGTCSSSENGASCPYDCDSAQQYALACLYGACSAEYAACLSSSGKGTCSAALECMTSCQGSAQSCGQSCASLAAGSELAELQALFACGLDNFCAD